MCRKRYQRDNRNLSDQCCAAKQTHRSLEWHTEWINTTGHNWMWQIYAGIPKRASISNQSCFLQNWDPSEVRDNQEQLPWHVTSVSWVQRQSHEHFDRWGL